MFNKEQSVGIGWGAKVKKTMKQKKIVKELKENGDGTTYLEFSVDELEMLGLESGDSVEWMQLEDGEVWKKVTKNEWCI